VTRNPVRRRIAADEAALGFVVRSSRSGEIARIALASGHDFLYIDTQHAMFSRETVDEIITACNGLGVAPLVRIRSADDPDASRFLDAGAAGLIVPDVSTAAQARRIVRTCRFPPLGARSLPGGPLIPFGRGAAPADEAMARSNAETLLVCMIETSEGVANADEIAALDGVDALHVGCVDLLVALGKPGQAGCPEVMAAIAQVARATRTHSKIFGIGGDWEPERRLGYLRDGARFLTTGTDTSLLLEVATERVAAIREVESG
jgi:staphyloferrin B biosynthesis citrate synthase